jgi:hypothetical protein
LRTRLSGGARAHLEHARDHFRDGVVAEVKRDEPDAQRRAGRRRLVGPREGRGEVGAGRRPAVQLRDAPVYAAVVAPVVGQVVLRHALHHDRVPELDWFRALAQRLPPHNGLRLALATRARARGRLRARSQECCNLEILLEGLPPRCHVRFVLVHVAAPQYPPRVIPRKPRAHPCA